MEKLRILCAVMVFFMGLPVETWAEANPFEKEVNVNIGSDKEWLIKDKTVTRSGSDTSDFYHIFYDQKQLRLRITGDAEDSEASARQYQQFAVEDILVDGERLPLFQWCLINQPKHSRYLQQGLRVKQDVCVNQGEKGAFVMRLNADTLDALEKGKTLSFKIKPFRSSINVNFDISDFSEAAAKLNAKVIPVQKEQAPVTVEKKVVTPKICKANPPKDFIKIKPVDYACDDAAAKARAEANIEAVVTKERELKAKLIAENERKRKEEEAAKKAKELADIKAKEMQAALEASAAAAEKEMNAEITSKMLAVCEKKWAKGEHRCYCEKYIDKAPAGIVSDPSCATPK
ncbi:MAG: hypothetical protein OEY66_00100 [Gammaproteobacteria bacterium]|nr:hypothetical protein [Gammaproteobacteria bacterium]